MVLPLLIMLASAGELDSAALTRRIEQSAAAAQAYQGAFDGGWRFHDGGAHRDLELIDPPSAPDHVGGAWRDGRGLVGYVDLRRLSDRDVELTFDGEGGAAMRLTRGADGVWRGEDRGRAVILERRLARER